MSGVSRRALLGSSGAVVAAAVLGACSDSSSQSAGGKGAGSGKKIKWWDHFGPLQPLQKKTFKKFEKSSHGKDVEFTWRNASKMGQALQLAKRSNQLPDVSSLAGLELPVPRLIKSGWLQPIDLDDDAMHRLKGDLYDGLHIFDKKLYSFPLFSFRQYTAAVWFNKSLAEKAGLDVKNPPANYDDFRDAARKVQKNTSGDVYGVVWNAGMPERMESQVNAMAQAAGFEGEGGVLYKTGKFAYDDAAYVKAIEFLQSLQKDKLLRPGSTNWSDKIARSHWVKGEACYYLDGPWCPGVALSDSKDFAEKLGVGSILVPERDMDVACYNGFSGGSFWLHKSSSNADAVNRLFSDFIVTKEYNKGLAEAMDQPPRDLSAVKESSAHDAYKHLLNLFSKQVYLAPNAIVQNVDVTKVEAESDQVKPTLGDIVQGALTGDVKDVKKSLKQLSDKSSKEREKALKAAKKKDAEVSLDDYAFPNWKPESDYTKKKYDK